MNRDPRIDPREGDRLHHPKFACGAEALITKVGMPKDGHTWQCRDGMVTVWWTKDNGHHIRNAGRNYSLRLWPEFMKCARVVYTEPTT